MVFIFVTIFRKENAEKTADNNDDPINSNNNVNSSLQTCQADQCRIKTKNMKTNDLELLELEEKKLELKKKRAKKLYFKRICIYAVFLSLLVISAISNKDLNSYSYQLILKNNFAPVLAKV